MLKCYYIFHSFIHLSIYVFTSTATPDEYILKDANGNVVYTNSNTQTDITRHALSTTTFGEVIIHGRKSWELFSDIFFRGYRVVVNGGRWNGTWLQANMGTDTIMSIRGTVGRTVYMMTSSNGNIFRVTGPLCGEFTGPGEFPTQRPVTRSFDVFFDLRLNKRLSKQPLGWWCETPSWSLWRQCSDNTYREICT